MLPSTCGSAAKPSTGRARHNNEQATRFIATPPCLGYAVTPRALLLHHRQTAEMQAVRNHSAQALGGVTADDRTCTDAPRGAGGYLRAFDITGEAKLLQPPVQGLGVGIAGEGRDLHGPVARWRGRGSG